VSNVLVLSYHAVSPDWPTPLAVDPERFRRQVALLAARGYHGVTVSEAVHPPARSRKLVAFTFDDAYRSVLDHGFPILRQFGFPGTVFVPTDWPDRNGPMSWPGIDHWLGGEHEAQLRCMDWAELRSLASAGWEVGAHGRSHPYLTGLSDASLTEELRGSRDRCAQEIDRGCDSLAYPYGAHDERVVRAVRDAGYATAVTVPDNLSSRDPLMWPRVGVYRSDGDLAFRAKISPTLRAVRSTPIARSLLPAVRAITQRRHR
jgi:peptidoglycan/xylan/chitin deacetylase (PgdA/CDA1 family)